MLRSVLKRFSNKTLLTEFGGGALMSEPKNQIVHLTHSRRKGREVLFKLKPRDKQREIEKEIKRIS